MLRNSVRENLERFEKSSRIARFDLRMSAPRLLAFEVLVTAFFFAVTSFFLELGFGNGRTTDGLGLEPPPEEVGLFISR